MSNYKIPECTERAIRAFVNHRQSVGSFVEAVLSNNLFMAYAYADKENKAAMSDIVMFVYNCVPNCCYGSPDKFKSWQNGEGEGLPIDE